MSVPLHDHEAKKQPMYCTLMREICHDGWTESMGLGDPKTGARPRCHKWVGIFINDKMKGQIREVFDCNEQWGTDLLQQVAQEIYQGAAATESVRNHVAENTGATKVVQSIFFQIAQAAGYKLKLPAPTTKGLPPPDENGKGGS